MGTFDKNYPDGIENDARYLDFLLKIPIEDLGKMQKIDLEALSRVKKLFDEHEAVSIEKHLPSGVYVGSRYYDQEGIPISLWEYSCRMDKDNHIAEETIEDFCISTVWLGLDHSRSLVRLGIKPRTDPPIIFETMIFGPQGNRFDDYQDRYSTKEQALEGHKTACEYVKRHLRGETFEIE